MTTARNRAVNLALARRAAALAPKRFEAVFNHGAALLNFNDPLGALEEFERALQLAPASHKAAVIHHMGLAHHEAGDAAAALRLYDQALTVNPDEPELRRSIAVAKLASGDLAQGLWEFEVEYYQPWRKPIFQSGLPRWRGEDLTGKTIIIAHEQGYGDSIQFCRAIPHIKAGRVLWSGPDELTGLIADNTRLDGVVPENGPFEADYYASPMSALAALRIDYPDIDGAPYMSADAMRLPKRGRLKVGLVWRGSPGHARDQDRSVALEDYAPLFEIPGLAFYSLQVGAASDDIHRAGLTGFVADLSPMIKDWQDTARAVAAMDAVVSVDTSTAHLAGALGVPTHLLINVACDWRWLHAGDTTPWYSSFHLHRQNVPGQWNYPIGQIARALHGQVAGRSEQGRAGRDGPRQRPVAIDPEAA